MSEVLGNGAGILAAASTIFSTFLLVFVAEWGDKSFFSTIGNYTVLRNLLLRSLHYLVIQVICFLLALAAASSPLGVIGGALAGHGLATLVIYVKNCLYIFL